MQENLMHVFFLHKNIVFLKNQNDFLVQVIIYKTITKNKKKHLRKQSSVLQFNSSLSVASPTQGFPLSDGGGSVHVRNLFRFLIPPPQLSLQLLHSPNEPNELQNP